MKWYLIDKIYGPLLAEGSLVQANSSKEALEKTINKKVKKAGRDAQYSVIESNEKGQYHYDRRKWQYYKIII